jgi:cytoskeletal protein CcmA (bactofilin family)
MFKREKDKSRERTVETGTVSAPAPKAKGEVSTTLIGGGTVVSGVVRVNGSLRVDGEAEGQVFVTDNLVVGPSGVMKAELTVGSAVVAGRVKGRIRAKGRVELQRGSRLEGDVHAATFKIEDGAFFQGNCVMGEAVAAAAAEEAKTAAASGDKLRVVGR